MNEGRIRKRIEIQGEGRWGKGEGRQGGMNEGWIRKE
jgi:hypothetical protein